MTDFIIEFILFAFQMLFWYTIANIFFSFLLYRAEKNAKQEVKQLVDHVMEFVHRVKVEQHHDHWYWYDADSDDFLAQGSTTSELIDRLKTRFPRHVFLLSDEEKGTVIKLSGPDWKMEKIATD